MFSSVGIAALVFIGMFLEGDNGTLNSLRSAVLVNLLSLAPFVIWHFFRSPWILRQRASDEEIQTKNTVVFGAIGLFAVVDLILAILWLGGAINRVQQSPTVHAREITWRIQEKPSQLKNAQLETDFIAESETTIPTGLLFNLDCNHELVSGLGTTNGDAEYLENAEFKVDSNDAKRFFYRFSKRNPPVGPEHPVVIQLWSNDPVYCKKTVTVTGGDDKQLQKDVSLQLETAPGTPK